MLPHARQHRAGWGSTGRVALIGPWPVQDQSCAVDAEPAGSGVVCGEPIVEGGSDIRIEGHREAESCGSAVEFDRAGEARGWVQGPVRLLIAEAGDVKGPGSRLTGRIVGVDPHTVRIIVQ